MAQPKYDKEFKQTIVDLLSLDTPKSINEICKEYNLKNQRFTDGFKSLKEKQELLKTNILMHMKKRLDNLKSN